MSNKNPEELAAEAREPGTFSFIERLRGRAYAKDDVTIYLNEELGYKLQELRSKLEASNFLTAGQITEIQDQIDEVKEELKPDAITFYLEGFSSDRYDELIADAKEQFPYEYEEVVEPWSGRKSQEIVQTNERTDYFLSLLWIESIVRVEDASGAIDTGVTTEFISSLKKFGPPAGIRLIQETIDKLRVSSDWIQYAEDEDFLVKP